MNKDMNTPAPYWQYDLSLGDGGFSDIPHALRMRLSAKTARSSVGSEIVPITNPLEERTFLHARPYLMDKELGDCHAWYSPTDRLLMLWKCVLYESEKAPQADQTLCAVWQGFERYLLTKFPETAWIATPSWEPIYQTKDYQAFLTTQGYAPINNQAFLKEVPKPEPHLTQ